MKLKQWAKKALGYDKKYRISFAQSGEDLIVQRIFNTVGLPKPSYIDIGAHDPYYLNNTALFYQNGSKGINVEPDPHLFANLSKVRTRDINLKIGIGESSGELPFYVMSTPTLNTFSKEQAESLAAQGVTIQSVVKVELDTLPNIVNRYCAGRFPDFLTLDVEGMEEAILRGIDYATTSPIVICVESISLADKKLGRKNTPLIDFLQEQGYMVYGDTFINTIFVRRDVWFKNR